MVLFKILLTFKDFLFLEMFSMVSDEDRGKRKMGIEKGNECPRRKGKHKVKREKRKMIEAVISGKPMEALMQCCYLKSEES